MLRTYNKSFLLLGISICAGAAPLHSAGPLETIKLACKDHTSERHDLAHKRHIYTAKHTVYKYGQLLSLAVSTSYSVKMGYYFMRKQILKKNLGITASALLTNFFFVWKKNSLEASLPALEAAERQARDADALRLLQQKQEREAQLAEKERKKQEDIQLEHERAEREAQKAHEAEKKAKLDAAAEQAQNRATARSERENKKRADKLPAQAAFKQEQRQKAADAARAAEKLEAEHLAEQKRHIDALTDEERSDIKFMHDLDARLKDLPKDQQKTIQDAWPVASMISKGGTIYFRNTQENPQRAQLNFVVARVKSLTTEAIKEPNTPSRAALTVVLCAILVYSNYYKSEKKSNQHAKLCNPDVARQMRENQRIFLDGESSDSITPGIIDLLSYKYLKPAVYAEKMKYAEYL